MFWILCHTDVVVDLETSHLNIYDGIYEFRKGSLSVFFCETTIIYYLVKESVT